jgi:MFS family permease|tara:strand:- start:1142 stop:2722 length:1581 start_codon:yes stop_codon:yes gene_type:complete
MTEKTYPKVGGRSAKITLVLLVIVYMFNFVDRQILSVLAEDIKADLNITDSDLGFLFGTAFAVFYSIFGIPLGKLADSWSRKNLLSIGLATWSLMTVLSGTAKSFGALSLYRVGVGIGESSASPSSYSILSDYFSPKIRSTILSIYSSGVYLGAGIGLFLGGWIVEVWTNTFPDPNLAPLGLKGWQAAFMLVGFPGIVLACFTWRIKEPKRGGSEGIESLQEESSPFKSMLDEFIGLSPLIILQDKSPLKALLINAVIASLISLTCYGLYLITNDLIQWLAFGVGLYLLSCWIQGLKNRDPITFGLIFKTKSLIFAVIGFPFIAFVTYSMAAFGPAFYMRNFGISEGEVATILGLITAVSGTVGVILGGYLGDKLRAKYINGRLYVGFMVIAIAIPTGLGFLFTESLKMSYLYYSIFQIATPLWVGIAPTTVSDLVLPRMRGVTGAFYILMVSMLGLALGPYTIGKLSDIFHTNGYSEAVALKHALAWGLTALSITFVALIASCYYLPKEEPTKLERAKALGESID